MLGQTLSHYRILDKLGEGGMGVVYVAEDVSLKRKVALKVLPPEVASDPERLQRFQREAEALAALNHPNIVTVYSVEHDAGRHFLTMELVEGKTVDRMISRGGLPVERLFELAIPLYDALAAAHARGIVHRDLKPANIVVGEEGRVKILDFGLAKLRAGVEEGGSALDTDQLTRTGTMLGTALYMAPEQLQGRPADHRSDLFSLGIVLYEMATGHHPFAGETAAEVTSSILRDEPRPLQELRPDLPRHLGRIVRLSLRKDPQQRLQTALGVRNELVELRRELETEGSGALEEVSGRTSSPSTRRTAWAWVAAGLLATALVVGALYWSRGDEPEEQRAEGLRPAQPADYFAGRRLSQLTFGATLEAWPAWSPDGERVVYSAEVGGFRQLFEREVATGAQRQLTHGVADAIQHAVSPAGTEIAFVRSSRPERRLEPTDVLGWYFEGGDIWVLDLEGGAERRVLEGAFHPAYSPDGERLAFDAEWAGPRRIWISDRRGLNPRQITTDVSEAVVHVAPTWSPDGAKIAFRRIEHIKSDIAVVEIATGAVRVVTDDELLDLDPVWSPTGRHIYFSSYRGGGLNLWRLPVSPEGLPTGPAEQLTTGAGHDLQLAVSPTGERLAFTVLRQNAELWRLPVDSTTGEPRGAPEPLVATTREESRGAWSPDGTEVAFNSDRGGHMNIWIRSLADGRDRQLTRGPGGDYQPTWSPDGRQITFFSSRAGHADIWVVDVESGDIRQLTSSPSLDINPFFSPDGRQIAFHSDREGRMDVWSMGADGREPRRLTSTGAGIHFLVWDPDGRSLVYRTERSGRWTIQRVSLDDGRLEHLPDVQSGAHMSFSPDRSLILDVDGHKTLWVYPVSGEPRRKVFEFDDPSIRIDYPVWSPEGRWVLFDRVHPQGADVWILEGL